MNDQARKDDMTGLRATVSSLFALYEALLSRLNLKGILTDIDVEEILMLAQETARQMARDTEPPETLEARLKIIDAVFNEIMRLPRRD